jgi:hypothetical protein
MLVIAIPKSDLGQLASTGVMARIRDDAKKVLIKRQGDCLVYSNGKEKRRRILKELPVYIDVEDKSRQVEQVEALAFYCGEEGVEDESHFFYTPMEFMAELLVEAFPEIAKTRSHREILRASAKILCTMLRHDK